MNGGSRLTRRWAWIGLAALLLATLALVGWAAVGRGAPRAAETPIPIDSFAPAPSYTPIPTDTATAPSPLELACLPGIRV